MDTVNKRAHAPHGFGIGNVNIHFQNKPEEQRTCRKTEKVNIIVHRKQAAVIKPLIFEEQKDQGTNECCGNKSGIGCYHPVPEFYKKPAHPDPDNGDKK